MDRARLLELLTELGRRLDERGLHADVYLVGGAAMAVSMSTRRMTRDVDVVFRSGADAAYSVAHEMAREHGLAPHWLSSAAAAFVPGRDTDADVLDLPGLSVAVASPRHLLAMKMIAARPGRDDDDLETLFAALEITAPHQAVAIMREVYGDNDVLMSDPPESYEFLAEDVLRRAGGKQDGQGPGRTGDRGRSRT